MKNEQTLSWSENWISKLFVLVRPPSGWLSLDRSVLDFVAQTIGVGKKTESSDTPTCTQTTHPMAPTPPAEAKARYAKI